MHYELLFPGKYLKASDLRDQDVRLTICPERGVALEEVQGHGGKKEMKPVMYFVETAAKARREKLEEKSLILNKTNAGTIAGLYGTDTDDWKGKRLILFPTKTQFGPDRVDCIRIKSEFPEE